MPLEIEPEIQWYIDRKLTHQLHTSERKAFRACRRRWNWVYREMYYPLTTPEPLEFGVAFHKAMEVFYEPRMWLSPLFVRRDLALVAFKQECQQHLKNYQKLNPDPDVAVLESYKSRIELGLNMLRYYCNQVSPLYDNNWTPIRVEVSFEVPIKHPDTGDQLWCKCSQCWDRWFKHPDWNSLSDAQLYKDWKGLPVTYGGRLDALFQDSLQRFWIADWKALPLNEKILTPSGWTTMGEVSIGQQVVGSNGKATTVIGVYPQGKKEVYRITCSDGSSVEATLDHLWTVESNHIKWNGRRYSKVMTTAQLIKELKKSRPNYRFLPELSPVEFDRQFEELNIPPYALGVLIGDGDFTQKSIRLSNVDGLEKYLPWVANPVGVPGNFTLLGAITDIKKAGLHGHKSIDKFIPEGYKYSSVDDRTKLLQGLMDTDGYVSKGNAIFCTSSYRLRDDFVQLVRSLGGSAYVFNDGLRWNANAESYQISIKLPEGICPFFANIKHKKGRWRKGRNTHQRIIRNIEFSRITETQCIKVDAPDQLFVTNDFLLTHNTTSRLLDEDQESSFLQLDDQIVSYLWALSQYGIQCAGFVYVEIKKAFPKPPEQLSRKYKGRSYSTDKSFMTTYDMFLATIKEHDNDAWQMGLYDDHLLRLKTEGPQFTQRHQIHKNTHEIEEAGRVIGLEALDMIDSPRVYPQPGRFSCNWCLFKQPCLGMNMGEDYVYTLDTMFERKRYHYWEQKEASTD
jgi:PD-(D/E)XK nuclease superfamily/LAGLIDADG-like domain